MTPASRRTARIAVLVLTSVASLAAAEVALRQGQRRGVLPYTLYATAPFQSFWADSDPAFGVWHPPYATFHHKTPCVDVIYHANSYGARDRERAKRSSAPRRIVVLGDSYVEGLDAADEERLTNRLEAATGIEHLNFGTGGGFGTIGELMLYRSLASTFDHTAVMLFTLPLNDFSDNEPAQSSPSRFRPYLRKGARGLELYYPVDFAAREQPPELSSAERLWNGASVSSSIINVARNLHRPRFARRGSGPSTYDAYTPVDVERMGEAYRRIAASAGARPVDVFIIPFVTDLERYTGRERIPFIAALEEQVRGVANIRIVDLLPDFAAYAAKHHTPPDQFFEPCDWHWSPLGQAVAADAVQRHVF